MALTTQTAIEQRLQVDFTNDPDPVITALIAAATAHMEAFLHRALESASYTGEVHDPRYPVTLDQWPVTAISAVAVDGTSLTLPADIIQYPRGQIYRASNGYVTAWGTMKPRSISVDYTAGYLAGTHDRELAHLGSICTEIVARAFRLAADYVATPAGAGDIQAISLAGSDSVTYATGAGTVSAIPTEAVGRFLSLTEADKAELNQYRALVVA